MSSEQQSFDARGFYCKPEKLQKTDNQFSKFGETKNKILNSASGKIGSAGGIQQTVDAPRKHSFLDKT